MTLEEAILQRDTYKTIYEHVHKKCEALQAEIDRQVVATEMLRIAVDMQSLPVVRLEQIHGREPFEEVLSDRTGLRGHQQTVCRWVHEALKLLGLDYSKDAPVNDAEWAEHQRIREARWK